MNRTGRQATAPVWRRVTVLVGLMGMMGILLVQAVALQLMEGDFLQGQADQRHLRLETLVAHRGAIHDRHGEALAISAPVDSVWAHPGVLLEEGGAEGVAQLAAELDLDASRLLDQLHARQEREFVYVRRHVNPEIAESTMALNLPGVALQREYRRFYPAGAVTGHVLGLTDIDDRGQEGIERVFDDWLAGESGTKRVLRDRRGRTIEDVERLKEPQPGRDLTLTLDLRLQYIAYRELKAAVEREQAVGGSVVLMDVHSGEILAMVNQPAFNPNRRSDLRPERLRNRAITDSFEPGSVTKPMTVAAAISSGQYTPGTPVSTAPGVMRVGGNQVRDIRDFGELTVTGVLQKSSNVGAARMALNIDSEAVWDLLVRFGFGETTGVTFPGESSGHMPAVPSRRPIERATLAFGYGLSTTPLQIARAYAAIAADGRIPNPSLVRGIDVGEPEQRLDSDLMASLRAMMVEVTREGGTATDAAIPGYQVAGKTGTSRKAIPGGYAPDRYISTFAGIAPAANPRFVAVVTIDEPNGDVYYAGPVAGPVFQSLMQSALRLYNVPPDEDAVGSTLSASERRSP